MSLTIKGPVFPPLQAVRFLKDMPGFFRDCAERYGDPFLVNLPMGKIAITGDPVGLKELFTADVDTFLAGNSVMLEPIMGSNSLLLLSGPRHKRERKLMMPMFHGERMRAYGEAMRESTQRAMEGIRTGDRVVALELAEDLSLEIIIRAVMGAKTSGRRDQFRQVLHGVTAAVTPSIMVLRSLRRNLGGFGPWARFQRARQAAEDLFDDEIAQRRARAQEGEDILSMLLAARDEEGNPMTDRELKDELYTLLLAGHDTTAIGITWALYWLHRTPEVKKKLEEELDAAGSDTSPDALARLPYLSAVCDEALRVRPTGGTTPRLLRVPFTLKGHTLPAGMGVYGSITLAHANPEVYPEPDRFRPERFLERKFSPFEYLPFGGGARRCIGAAFASYQMRVVLATLVGNHGFSQLDARMAQPVRRNVTFFPKGGLPLRYEGLRSNSAPQARRSAAG